MLSMHNIGERLLGNTLLNDIQANYLENLSTAKSENVVKQIDWQKWSQGFQYGTHNFEKEKNMYEIKTELKKYILTLMTDGSTPTQILPELIRQYEVLDQKYPDLKEVNAPAEEEPFNFEDTLLSHVKAITQALREQKRLTGSSFDLAIYNSCTVINEIDNSDTPVKTSRVIYVDK